jgi:cytoskeletal protein CcmA (bactofilin family)
MSGFAEEEKRFWTEIDVLRDQHWLSASFQGNGEWNYSGNIRFAGRWEGKVEGQENSSLQILKGAYLKAELHVKQLLVEGELEDCKIFCEHLHLKKGARVSGKICAARIIIEEGAVVEAEFSSSKQ